MFSVGLYWMLFPPTLLNINFLIPWQLVLDINVPLPSLVPPPFLWSMNFTGLAILGVVTHLRARWSLICRSRRYFIPILTNAKFENVTSTYYHTWYLVFEFTFNVTYFHRVIDIQCMCLYLVHQALNILFSVVSKWHKSTLKLVGEGFHWIPFIHKGWVYVDVTNPTYLPYWWLLNSTWSNRFKVSYCGHFQRHKHLGY